MTAKTYAWIVLSWLVLVFLSGLVDGVLFGQSDLNVALSMQVLEFKQVFFIPIPVPSLDWFNSMFNLSTWNFSFFSGNAQWLRWFIGLPILGALAWGFITTVLPTVIAGISALANALNAINPFS